MVKIRDLEVEYRSVDGLASHARNPRTHSKKQIHRIAESIRAFDLNLEFDLTLTGFETSEGDDGNRYADFADGADGSRVRHVHELRGLAKGAAMHCQTVSVCAPSIAVLVMAEPILRQSSAVRFEAEAMSFEGRTGAPEPHPPKSAALL